MSVVDFTYNRPRPSDNDAPLKISNHLNVPYFAADLIHCGGNYMTDGLGVSASTDLVFEENDIANDQVLTLMEDYYGIDTDLTPPLVSNFENQGKVTGIGASNTGLPEGIPIRYRAGDQPNNALSLNILRPGEVAATGGTSGVLFAISDRNSSKAVSYTHLTLPTKA